MLRRVDSRLSTLERKQAPDAGSILIVQQTADDPTLFEDANGLIFDRSDIDQLSAAGWRCILLKYADEVPAL